MDTTFLTCKEVAEILKIGKSLAYRLISKGEIPSFRFGRIIRVRQADPEKFIAEKIRRDQPALNSISVDIEVEQNSRLGN